jgi:hypothetical protein
VAVGSGGSSKPPSLSPPSFPTLKPTVGLWLLPWTGGQGQMAPAAACRTDLLRPAVCQVFHMLG